MRVGVGEEEGGGWGARWRRRGIGEEGEWGRRGEEGEGVNGGMGVL